MGVLATHAGKRPADSKTRTAVANGPTTVTVTADDGNGGTASQSFTWVANDTALSVQVPAISATDGIPANGLTVATFTDLNVNSLPTDFSAVVNWGDGSSDPGVVDGSNGSYTVTDNHTYAQPGSYNLSVTVTDSGGSTATATTAQTVASAPLSTNGVLVYALLSQSFSGPVAEFGDANPNEPAGNYPASITWGDGNNSNGSVSGSNGQFFVTGTHTYTSLGTDSMSVTITDTTDHDTITATGQASVGNVYAGATAGVTASPFTAVSGATPQNSTARINWGDGTYSGGQISGTTGNLTVNGSHLTYGQDGTDQVTITVWLVP